MWRGAPAADQQTGRGRGAMQPVAAPSCAKGARPTLAAKAVTGQSHERADSLALAKKRPPPPPPHSLRGGLVPWPSSPDPR